VPETQSEAADEERPEFSTGKKLAFLAVMLLVPALAAEGICRIIEKPATNVSAIYDQDAALQSIRLHPGLEKRTIYSGYGVVISVSSNSLGHRSPELAVPKPKDVYRIACLGGSSTYGFGALSNSETYPARLPQLLTGALLGKRIEVLNMGTPGWTTRESLLSLQLERYTKLELDMVIVGHGYNDLISGALPPYLSEPKLLTAEEIAAAKKRSKGLLRKYSAAYRRLRRALLRLRLRHAKLRSVSKPGLEATRRNLGLLVKLCAAKNIRLVFLSYPHLFAKREADGPAVFPQRPKLHEKFYKRAPLSYPAIRQGMDQVNQLIRDIAKESGAVLIDLDKEMPKQPALYVDYIHQSNAGHALRAKLIAKTLRSEVFAR